MDNEKQQSIHDKGFDMGTTTYGKMKVGVKYLDDAVLNLGSLKSINSRYSDKRVILQALADCDLAALRDISNYFYRTNGIYQRACNYFATMYRYDWYVVPEVYDEKVGEEKIVKDFVKVLNYLDNSYVKKVCGDIALSVVKNGVYYGYVTEGTDGIVLQELPIRYCRSRYFVGNKPAIEFNMRFFDEQFPDVGYRMRVLKMFPKEFAKGYVLYKQNKLTPDFMGDTAGSWYLLDPDSTVKFSFTNGELPLFVNSIPAILDLDAAQDLDRRKQMQKLLKILVQKLPLDKNGDLIFDIDEARDIHNNAVEMLSRAIGVDVLTTFTDVESIDMADKSTTASTDDLAKVERAVYNAMGISQKMFNTDGNIALNNSILNDEGTVRSLLLQFGVFFDRMTQAKSGSKKKYNFRLYMLETTQYNYKELAKTYKELISNGYPKTLPMIALGHSQSSVLNTLHFENEILNLSELMIPPLSSNTLNSEDILDKTGQATNNKTDTQKQGRPEKSDDQKSEKTLQNQESLS